MSRSTQNRKTRRSPFIVLLVVAVIVASAGTAFAFWSASTNVNATGQAGTLAAPTAFSAAATGGTTANLTWTAPANATSYTLSQSPGSIAGCSATPTSGTTSCTATGLTASTSYTWTLTAVFNNWTSASAQATATTESGVGPAAKLTFTAQPTSGQNIQATGTGSFSVSAAVQDSVGNTVTTDTRSITLAIDTNPSAGVLSCTNPGSLTVAAVSGVASFTGCAITETGTGYTLTAGSSPSLTSPANANSFNITAGAANRLNFTTQPTVGQNIQATGTGSFSTAVAVEDINGNTVLTDNTRTVTLSIGTNPSSGVLTCTGGLGPKTVTSGVASFSGCAITKTGTGYKLNATSSPALTAPANANLFNITAGTATTIATVSGSAQTASISTAFTNPLVAVVTDTNANPVSGVSVTFTGPSSGASATFAAAGCTSNPQTYSCVATTAANGQATSSTFTANATAGTYNVSASASGTNTVNFSETNLGPLTITTVTRSGGNAKHTFSGTGGNAGSTITVSVCTTNNFPACSSVTSATATVAADGTWTTGQSTTNIAVGTTYFARAVQTTPAKTSAVFQFVAS